VDRIAIIGCGGSGKSRLARALGTTLGVTPVHLDGLYYDRDWKPLDKEQFAVLQRDMVAAPRWIIDGNYGAPRGALMYRPRSGHGLEEVSVGLMAYLDP
jgi:adenylate kinase family enzyme